MFASFLARILRTLVVCAQWRLLAVDFHDHDDLNSVILFLMHLGSRAS